jgi:SAGA-associated factor 73
VDSDEELTLVMAGLSNWNPQPVVPPLVHVPIDRKYQKQRLYEQMFQATNGFTQNIFAVKGYGAQKLPVGHPGLTENGENGNQENDGMTGIQMTSAKMADRKLSGFNMQQPPQRKQSNSAQRG